MAKDTQAASAETNTKPADTSNGSGAWTPEDIPQLTVDVYRKGDIIYVVSTVAGVEANDLDITVDGNDLTIRGSRKRPYPEDQQLLLNECFWGEFSRELTINENINVDEITAELSNGVLTVMIPIIVISGHKRISVMTPADAANHIPAEKSDKGGKTPPRKIN